MPSTKKKKPVSNPARGYATVSIPSKPKVVDSAGISSADSVGVSDNKIPPSDTSQGPKNEQKDSTVQSYTSHNIERHLEDAELQSFIDTYGSKCKYDSSREVTKLETERRLLRPQADLLDFSNWLSPETVDLILELAKREEEGCGPNSESAASSLKEDELCARLWTLKYTLLKLGLSELETDNALRYIISRHSRDGIWKLDEIFSWLVMHSDNWCRLSYEHTHSPRPRTPEPIALWIADTKRTQLPTTYFVAGNSTLFTKGGGKNQQMNLRDSSNEDSDSSIDPDDLIPEFISLQSQLYSLQPNYFDRSNKVDRPLNDSDDAVSLVTKIQRKLSRLEKDVLFDREEAERKWREKLTELRKEAAFTRQEDRRGKSASVAYNNKDKPTDQLVIEKDLSATANDNLDFFGDMFLIDSSDLEPPSINGTQQPSIVIRDFGRTDSISTTPRQLLEETCKAKDPACKLVYRDIHSSSHSNRKALQVQWSKPQDIPPSISLDTVTHKSNTLVIFASMELVSAKTPQQAEGFISTFVLFLISASDPKCSKAYLRLPPTWMGVWVEFVNTKKQQDDRIDKASVQILKRLIEENKCNTENDVALASGVRKRGGTANQTASTSTGAPLHSHEVASADQLKGIWARKASGNSFKHMVRFRMNLPVWGYKQDILDILKGHQAIIICSETGSGKSTQIPSFILAQELANGRSCKIYVTEPRRISAISLARRVSEELGENKKDVGTSRSLVGYSIRLESKICQSTRLVYATTGIVVRMLERPSDFHDITHIVLDEVHERSIDTDFLLIVLRRLMRERAELKVILMSATVDAERFSSYLNGAPVLNIPGRTYPVEVKYLEDVIELVDYSLEDTRLATSVEDGIGDDDEGFISDRPMRNELKNELLETLRGYTEQTRDAVLKFDDYRLDYRLITKLLANIATKPEIRRLHDKIINHPTFEKGWVIHILHSSVSSEDQEKAFIVPPEGVRKIVIATNIAETGITIPDITAVIDSGKEKLMRFDEKRQLSKLIESFISRANAKQRRGRAGRVRNGICFHLFTKHRHEKQLEEQQTPEILRLSLQDLVLRVKIYNLGEVEQTLLEALDPPSLKNIRRAVESLKQVKALINAEDLTPLGKQLAKLPLDVFLGKLVIYGTFFKCLDACISIAAILSTKSPFVNSVESNTEKELAKLYFKRGDSDLLTVYNAYSAWRRTKSTPGANEYVFCRKNFLSPQTLLNIEDIKTQLLVSIVDAGFLNLDVEEQTSLRRARFTGRQRHLFTIPERFDINSKSDLVINSVIAWSFYPKLLTREGESWRNVANKQTANLYPTSVNRQSSSPPKWLSFYNMMQAHSKAYNAHETSAVEDFAVALLCGDPEFKLYPGVISLDGNRVRFAAKDWKEMLAFKTLSLRVRGILSDMIKNPQRNPSHRQQEWLDILQQIFSQAR